MDEEIFVSVSVGNDGPSQLTASASFEKAISVGACTKEDYVYYKMEIPKMGKTFECVASKQTTGIKEEYNLTILNDFEDTGCSRIWKRFSDTDAVLVIISDCEPYEKAVNIKSSGAGLMIIGEASSYSYSTSSLPSIHCNYYTVVSKLLDYVYENGTVPMKLTRIREEESKQDK